MPLEPITKPSELVGKTIAKISSELSCASLAMVFTDGSFVFLDAEDYSLILKQLIHHYDLFKLGLISREEIERMQAEHQAKERAEREAAERREYERLKAKYAPADEQLERDRREYERLRAMFEPENPSPTLA